MIVVLNSFSFTSKNGYDYTCIDALSKVSGSDSYNGKVQVKFERLFLSDKKFGLLRFSPGEIIEVDWERNYKGQAVPKSVRSTGEFDPNINEFMSY